MPLKANQFKQVFTRRTAKLNTACNVCVPILCHFVHLPCLGTVSSVCLNEFVGDFKLDRFGIRGWHFMKLLIRFMQEKICML